MTPLKNVLMLFSLTLLLQACTIRLINVPGEQTGASNAVELAVTVETSSEFIEYQFRLVTADSPDADCTANVESYGPMQPRDTLIVQDFSGMPDGPLKLCVRGRGTTTTTNEEGVSVIHFYKIASGAWTKDTVAPGAFAITGPIGVQGINQPTITWEAAEGASSYQLDITSDAACQNVYRSYSDITGTSKELTDGLANGFWHICVKAKDLASNESVASNNGLLMTVDAPFKYVFATSTEYTATQFGGISGADHECTLHGFIGNLIPDWDGEQIVFKALMSDSTVNAKDRMPFDRSIFNRNNQLVSFGLDWFSQLLFIGINYDENGSAIGAEEAWTGSNADGTFSGQSCSDWSTESGLGTAGQLTSTSSQWIQNTDGSCSESKHLYCVGPF